MNAPDDHAVRSGSTTPDVHDPERPPSVGTSPLTLETATTAEQCLQLAGAADEAGDAALLQAALERAVALDRNCQPALLSLAAMALDEGAADSTLVLLEEAARIAPLPDEVETLRSTLFAQREPGGSTESYLRAIGRIAPERSDSPLSVVLVTNLFPPHELGGYGRMMWEFAHGLVARGHRVRVLTANADQFAKSATADEQAFETNVLRTLELLGTWQDGRPQPIRDQNELRRRIRDNAARVRTAITKSAADLVLAGNLDMLGVAAIRPALDRRVPVLHALANAAPGYRPGEQPPESFYWVAPCSDWNGTVYRQGGYNAARVETLYPGARLDRFLRLYLPDRQRLRICYASLVLPYKGADTLVAALTALHRAGVDFTAEIAGDAPDPVFRQQLQEQVQREGMADKVRFPGFLDRAGLAALFARSNVLAFPSRFEEPFGISQVEAMAAGLVVVSSGTGGAREIVRDQEDGLLFAAGSAADLAEKLYLLVRQPDLMARLQRNAQTRAGAFSVDHAVRKIETLAAELQAGLQLADAPAPELTSSAVG